MWVLAEPSIPLLEGGRKYGAYVWPDDTEARMIPTAPAVQGWLRKLCKDVKYTRAVFFTEGTRGGTETQRSIWSLVRPCCQPTAWVTDGSRDPDGGKWARGELFLAAVRPLCVLLEKRSRHGNCA